MYWARSKNYETLQTLATHYSVIPSCRHMIQTFKRSQVLGLFGVLCRSYAFCAVTVQVLRFFTSSDFWLSLKQTKLQTPNIFLIECLSSEVRVEEANHKRKCWDTDRHAHTQRLSLCPSIFLVVCGGLVFHSRASYQTIDLTQILTYNTLQILGVYDGIQTT